MKIAYDLVCFSHLRWAFVYQRPQHLLSRCAKQRRVFFIEEPIFGQSDDKLEIVTTKEGVVTATPMLMDCQSPDEVREKQQSLLASFSPNRISITMFPGTTPPLALDWIKEDNSLATVYDCMDELAAFKGAPTHLKDCEKELFKKADLVFTGGASLYEHKKASHSSVYAFPSSVDVPHFAKAQLINKDPEDQKVIAHPRLGFFGVVDERMNIELLDQMAALRPEYQFVVIGPVVKIDQSTLPRRSNIHYLGSKKYEELPDYISGWDVALMPFALNESTKFISPTKTPEYLAAGRPVVSTSITDVVRPYGEEGLVHIADDPESFVQACDAALAEDFSKRMAKVEPYLSKMSWDSTWRTMAELIDGAVESKNVTTLPTNVSVRKKERTTGASHSF